MSTRTLQPTEKINLGTDKLSGQANSGTTIRSNVSIIPFYDATPLVKKGIKFAQDAVKFDRENNYSDALESYRVAVACMKEALATSGNERPLSEDIKITLQNKIVEYTSRADLVQSVVNQQRAVIKKSEEQKPSSTNREGSAIAGQTSPTNPRALETNEKKEKDQANVKHFEKKTDIPLNDLEKFRTKFGLAEDDLLIADYYAVWDERPGRLFVSKKNLFFENEQGAATKIEFKSIKTIEKHAVVMFNVSLIITTIDSVEYKFYKISNFGECIDLVVQFQKENVEASRFFNVPLKSILRREGSTKQGYPLLVQQIFETLSQEPNVSTLGLFRVSPELTQLSSLAYRINRGYLLPPVRTSEDCHIYCGILKKFLRELPDPILTNELYNCFIAVYEMVKEKPDFLIQKIKSLVATIPKVNLKFLQEIMKFLLSIAKRSEENKMTTGNLALIFGPILLGTGEDDCAPLVTAGGGTGILNFNMSANDFLASSLASNALVKEMLDHHEEIFGGENS